MEWNQGHIDQINFEGIMKIQNGPTIRINDTSAVLSAGYSSPLMVADDVNPSVTAFSASQSRPHRSGYRTSSLRRAFRLGSEITFYEIAALNVQITTTGAPAYVGVEENLVGIYTAETNAEVAGTRFVGHVWDPSVTVFINTIDIDPCTGRTTERSVGVGQNRPETGVRNKWLSCSDGTQTSVYTREYRAIASTGTVRAKNAKLLNPGNELIVKDYSQTTYLTKGISPDEDGHIFGSIAPSPTTIGTAAITDATAKLLARSNDTPTLHGFQDNPSPNLSDLTWTWSLLTTSSGTPPNLSVSTPSADTHSLSIRFSPTVPHLLHRLLFHRPDTVTAEAVSWTSSRSGTLDMSFESNYLVDSKVEMQVAYPGDAGTTACNMAATPPGSGV
ncbi:hypothetical protein VTI74DRAFT_1070 [Chaetomium olivicolor]